MTASAPPIAVMQGRLLPPVDGELQAFPAARWREELALAAEAGLDALEWIYDEGPNPLDDPGGPDEIRALAERHGVRVGSVCGDRFMRRPLAGPDGERALEDLRRLVRSAAELGARYIVVPFVDASALESPEQEELAAARLAAALPDAGAAGVELHVETSLPPDRVAALLERVPGLRVTYDTGNSAALGHDPEQELAAFGERVGSVHVKDRVRGGGSVPLGEGDARLDTVFAGLRRLGYAGTLVLQVARGEPGAELEWVRSARDEVERRWREAA